MDDITFCLSDCQRTDCDRHPSNIQDRTIPHSYADFKGTETCPEKMQLSKEDATKDATFDCIDRQAALNCFHDWVDRRGDVHTPDEMAEYRALEALPSVQPQRWIPVTERLPEDYQDVLVWFEYYRYGRYNRMYSTYGIGTYSKRYDSWMVNHESGWKNLRVIAWMPLPEPWRGKE